MRNRHAHILAMAITALSALSAAGLVRLASPLFAERMLQAAARRAGVRAEWKGFSLTGICTLSFTELHLKRGNAEVFANGLQVVPGTGWLFGSGDFLSAVSCRSLAVSHPALAPEPVAVKNFAFTGGLFYRNGKWSFRQDAKVSADGMQMNLRDSFFDRRKKEIRLKAEFPEADIRTVMELLQMDRVGRLEGMGASGRFSFSVDAMIPLTRAEEFSFKVEFDPGDVTFAGLPEAIGCPEQGLEYCPEQSERCFTLNPGADAWVTLKQMPSLLPAAVLVAEDPAFYEHGGVDTSILAPAMAENISAGKFRRGGSTIPMQLVKNLLLNRDKNALRKLQEYILVWAMTSQPGYSKDQTLELYLNLIEWGPEVYGIREAADFYFGKEPAQLSADECVFLAAIIPNPKHYYSFFSSRGELTEFAEGTMEGIRFFLYEKDLLNDEEMDTKWRLHFAPSVRRLIHECTS